MQIGNIRTARAASLVRTIRRLAVLVLVAGIANITQAPARVADAAPVCQQLRLVFSVPWAPQGHWCGSLASLKLYAPDYYMGAQGHLGLYYLHGAGDTLYGKPLAGAPNYSRAAYWLWRAARQGSAGAAWTLGQLYATGRGVPKSATTAYTLFEIAARSEGRPAWFAANEYAKSLTTAQRGAASAAVDTWSRGGPFPLANSPTAATPDAHVTSRWPVLNSVKDFRLFVASRHRHRHTLGTIVSVIISIISLLLAVVFARHFVLKHIRGRTAQWLLGAFIAFLGWRLLDGLLDLAVGSLVLSREQFGGSVVDTFLFGWALGSAGARSVDYVFTKMTKWPTPHGVPWYFQLRGYPMAALLLFLRAAGAAVFLALIGIPLASTTHPTGATIGSVGLGMSFALVWTWPATVILGTIHRVWTALSSEMLHRENPDAKPKLEPDPPLRGTWLVTADSVYRHVQWERTQPGGEELAGSVVFGSQLLTPADEVLHTKILGTTGAGKSTAIRRMLRTVAARPAQRVVIADPDGGYLSKFYNPARGDLILNPFDARSIGWNLFEDVKERYDADGIAASLVPERQGHNSEWSLYAQQLVSAAIAGLRRTRERPTTADLYVAVAAGAPADLAQLTSGTPAAPFFAPGNEKMLGSIRATAASALAGLAYIDRDGPGVSYWPTSGRGWLFMPYRADQIASLKSVISTWLRILIFATMSRPEGDSGTWFVIDELDALGKIAGLTDALVRLRRFGGRCVIGTQSIGLIEEVYGSNMVGPLLENCNNTMILRCGSKGDKGTSAYAAGLLGKREVLKSQWQTSQSGGQSAGTNTHSQGMGSNSGQNYGWSKSHSESYQVEDVMLPSEIEALQPLHGACHAAHSPFWSHCRLAPDDMPLIAPAFVSREGPSAADASAETPNSTGPAAPSIARLDV